jgi:hypothetical protein
MTKNFEYPFCGDRCKPIRVDAVDSVDASGPVTCPGPFARPGPVTRPSPRCPECNSNKVIPQGGNHYHCNNCGHDFTG